MITSQTKVLIVDYQMGNVASVKKAFQKIGADAIISANPAEINAATHLVLPGVGAFPDGIKNLKKNGLAEILNQKVLREKTPILGICLGMQLMAKKSFEFGEYDGLGWLNGEVKKLSAENTRLPHMGWNDIEIISSEDILKDIPDKNFYFVHSYHLDCVEKDIVTSYCEYGQKFIASVRKDNIFAVQFHPEKSQTSGLKVLKNFLTYA